MTVSYERFRKVCPQCNTVVHAMEFSRSMRLRKVCLQYSYRSACEEVSLWLWPCLRIEEKESTLYCHWGAWECRKALLSEEELLVAKQGGRQSLQRASETREQARTEFGRFHLPAHCRRTWPSILSSQATISLLHRGCWCCTWVHPRHRYSLSPHDSFFSHSNCPYLSYTLYYYYR